MDKANTFDLSIGVFAILISVTQTTKIQCQLWFHRFHKKTGNVANSDITKETPNCIASLQQLTALLTPLVSSGILFCDLKTINNSSQIGIQL